MLNLATDPIPLNKEVKPVLHKELCQCLDVDVPGYVLLTLLERHAHLGVLTARLHCPALEVFNDLHKGLIYVDKVGKCRRISRMPVSSVRGTEEGYKG